MYHHPRRRLIRWPLIALVALALGMFAQAALGGRDPVAAAWERARSSGAYHFRSDVAQETAPAATAANIGRSSRVTRLYLEGQTDLPARRTELQLWAGGGSVADPSTALGVRLEDGRTFVRQGGGEWRESDEVSLVAAPEGDALAFLAAVRDVRALGREERAGRAYTRYGFTLDGPELARYLRDQSAASMRRSGELPVGLGLGTSEAFARLSGEGELWVGDDGLPLRQVVELRLPEQQGERVSARIVTDLSRFAPLPAGPLGLGALGRAAGGLLADPQPLLALALTLALAVALVRWRRSRRLAAALALTLVVTLVAGPLLSSLKVRSFLDVQAAQAAGQEERRAAQEARQGLAEAGPEHDPRADTLAAVRAAAPAAAEDQQVDADGDTLSDYVERRAGTNPKKKDSDNDGVDDNLELAGFTLGAGPNAPRWFTDPRAADSNGDGLADGLEWRRDLDGDGRPDDIDADGLPDLFDADDDGDGVPDRLDASQIRRLTPAGASAFGEQRPLRLEIDGLSRTFTSTTTTPGGPVTKTSGPSELTYVDFQLRPLEAEHLWYAFNVLDWPIDRGGTVRDIDGKTFADQPLPAGVGRHSPVDAYGDMRVVPVLELRYRGQADNLPDAETLKLYNLSTDLYDADGDGTKESTVVYVPLTVVTASDTGERVAFGGRMVLPTTKAWRPVDVRLAWVVQMLVDDKCTTDTATGSLSCAEPNALKVVQTYYDDYVLTGLNVREDHGARAALIYEDPLADPDLKDDSFMVAMAQGLENAFLHGRDDDKDGRRDVTVADLAGRFDHRLNTAVGADGRLDDRGWGLPATFRVRTVDAAHLDGAVARMAQTDTPGVLGEFADRWGGDRAIAPLLLYAHESEYRVIGLDFLGESYASSADSTLSLHMAPAGAKPIGGQVGTGLKASPFCADGVNPEGKPAWYTCDLDAYWRTLDARYADQIGLPGESDTARAGTLMAAQIYYLSLISGVSAVAETDGWMVGSTYALKSDPLFARDVRSLANGGAKALTALMNFSFFARFEAQMSLKEWLGAYKFLLFNKNLPFSKTMIGDLRLAQEIDKVLADKDVLAGALKATAVFAVGVAFIFALYTVMDKLFYAGDPSPDSKIGTGVVYGLMATLTFVLSVALPFFDMLDVFLETNSLAQAAMKGVAVSNTSRATGFFGAALSIGIAVAFFIYSFTANDVKPGSPAFNRGLAELFATASFAIFMAVISLTLIGAIIAGLVGVVDLILLAICELGVEGMRNVPGMGGACFTLSTGAVKGLTYLLYSYDAMVDLEHTSMVNGQPVDDLVVSGDPTISRADGRRGYVAGNALGLTLPITVTAAHKDPEPENWKHIIPYLAFFSEDNLRSSTFAFSLTSRPAGPIDVERGTMSGEWGTAVDHTWLFADVDGVPVARDLGKDMYIGRADFEPSLDQPVSLEAGIDRTLPFYLNMGYAIPAYECWTVPVPAPPPIGVGFVPVCYKRDLEGHSSNQITSIKLDIFPASIGELMRLADVPGGRRLAWDERFPALHDADNDGLAAPAHGGVDDDRSWDSDHDGLSDRIEYELALAGNDVAMALADRDGDGLTDRQELDYGTNPARADSDNDGLRDGEELRHAVIDTSGGSPRETGRWEGGWTVTITGSQLLQPMAVLATSDPNRRDSDGDGLSDAVERQLAGGASPVDKGGVHYHPRVPNLSPLELTLASDDADGIVRPGQQLTITGSVSTDGQAFAPGVLSLALPPALGGATSRLRLDPAASPSAAASFTLPDALPASGEAVVSGTVRARLQGGGATGWAWMSAEANPGTAASTFAPRGVAVAAGGTPAERFLVAGLRSEQGGQRDRGQVSLLPFPGGGERVIDGSDPGRYAEFLRGASAPDVVCNDSGDCYTVWDEYDTCNRLTFAPLSVSGGEADNDDDGMELYISLYRGVRDLGNAPAGPDDPGYYFSQWGLWKGNAGQYSLAPLSYCGPVTLEAWEYEADGKFRKLGRYVLDEDTVESFPITFSLGGKERVEFRATIDPRTPRHRYTVAGALTDATGKVLAARAPLPTPDESDNYWYDYHPVVASDGQGFLAVWERVRIDGDPWTSRLFARRISASGVPVGQEIPLGEVLRRDRAPGAQDPPGSGLQLDLAWAGDGYRLVWRASDPVRSLSEERNKIKVMRLSRDGMPGPITVAATDADPSPLGAPALAYNPRSNGRLLAYRAAYGAVHAMLEQSDGTYRQVSNLGAGALPRASFDPTSGGWLIGTRSDGTPTSGYLLQPYAADMSRMLLAGQVWTTGPVSTSDWGLACAASGAAPLAELRFEELPGATSFASAGRGPSAQAGPGGAAPSPGAPAKLEVPAPPYSDYALAFDGGDYADLALALPRQSTLSFWFRADAGGGRQVLLSALPNAEDLRVALEDGVLVARAPSSGSQREVRSSVGLADGKWHHVALSVRALPESLGVASITLFVDGEQQQELRPALAPTAASLRLGANSVGAEGFRGELDDLRVYSLPFDQATARALYKNGSLDQACYAAAAQSGAASGEPQAIPTIRFGLRALDPRGAGPIDDGAELALTVDADAPTSGLTSHRDGQYVRGEPDMPVSLVLAGTAADQTTRVTRVDLSLDGGEAVQVGRGEAWLYEARLDAGVHSLRTRAADLAGNLADFGPPTTLIVDAGAPTAALAAPGAPLAPARGPDGAWRVRLAGSASDPAVADRPGSGVAGVELRLLGGPGASDWQRADLGQDGSWQLDYALAGDDVSGAYTVELRVADAVGNTATVAGAAGLQVDGAAPTATFDGRPALEGPAAQPKDFGGSVSDEAGAAALEVGLTALSEVVAATGGGSLSPDGAPGTAWHSAALAAPGAITSTWSLSLPAELEGHYQVDLRAADGLGNRALTSNVWRGLLDNRAPRLTVEATPTGAQLAPTGGGETRYEVGYRYSATDQHLDPASFVGPCVGQVPSSAFDDDPALRQLFPDLALRNHMEVSCHTWVTRAELQAPVKACDSFGNCATAAPALPAEPLAVEALAADGAPRAFILSPGRGRVLAGTRPLDVEVAAEASAGLATVEILLDGKVAQALSYTGGAAQTSIRGTVSLDGLSPGDHTIGVRATDRRGAAQPAAFEIAVSVDGAAPVVSLETSAVDEANSYAVGSNIVRLSGVASDERALAAVQVQVGDGPFADATFAAGGWHAAVWLGPESYGLTYQVTVRATDFAGQTSEASRELTVGIPRPEPVDPASLPPAKITSSPADPSRTDSASFGFRAEPEPLPEGSSFECRLDGGRFEPCASPASYSGLAEGRHTFEVRTVNQLGQASDRPAQHSWTVAGCAKADQGCGRMMIYGDSLAKGWRNRSWDTSVDFGNKAPARSGQRSIAATFQNEWAGLRLHLPSGISTSGMSRVRLWVHGGEQGGQQIQLYVVSDDGSTSPAVRVRPIEAGRWRVVEVPLAKLGSPSRITDIVIQARGGPFVDSFYVDDLSLTP